MKESSESDPACSRHVLDASLKEDHGPVSSLSSLSASEPTVTGEGSEVGEGSEPVRNGLAVVIYFHFMRS